MSYLFDFETRLIDKLLYSDFHYNFHLLIKNINPKSDSDNWLALNYFSF